MQSRQLRTLESARQVQAFLDDNASVIGRRVPVTVCERLDDAVEQFAAHEVEQELSQQRGEGTCTAPIVRDPCSVNARRPFAHRRRVHAN